MTKVLMLFNAVLTFYILNSQDRRFAQVDADAKVALQQASDEMRGSVTEALSFGRMFSGAFGGKFGGGGGGGRAAPSAPPSSGGGFTDNMPPASSQDPNASPAWPSGSGGGGGGGGGGA